MTQQELADACGLRFQQVHKYETAANRISVAMLCLLARALDVDVGYLCDGLVEGGADPTPRRRIAAEPRSIG